VFRRPAFVGATLAAIALAASLFSVLLYVTLYLQDVLGCSALQAGLRFLPLTLPILLVAPVAGRMSERVPLRFLIGAGLALAGVGLALMTVVDTGSRWTALLAGLVVGGAGSGLINPPLASAAIGTVAPAMAGVGSGVNNTARQAGVAAGVAALGAVFQSRVATLMSDRLAHAGPQLAARRHEIVAAASSGDPRHAVASLPPGLRGSAAHAVRVAFVGGFDRVLWVAAAIAVAGAILSVVLVRPRDFAATDLAAVTASGSAPTEA
jgi:MFS family permease